MAHEAPAGLRGEPLIVVAAPGAAPPVGGAVTAVVTAPVRRDRLYGTVARILDPARPQKSTVDTPALHRVHEPPDVKKVADFEEFISTLGYGLGGGAMPKPKHFQKLIDRIRGHAPHPCSQASLIVNDSSPGWRVSTLYLRPAAFSFFRNRVILFPIFGSLNSSVG